MICDMIVLETGSVAMAIDYSAEIAEENRCYNFRAMLEHHNLILNPLSIETLWLNITRQCNQSCTHCHVNASPDRTEQMNRSVIDHCLEILARYDSFKNLDITGGAPELNPNFNYLVVRARKLNKHVTVRHNLTVTIDGNPQTGESKKYLPEFFAENQVEVLASLPHYEQDYTDHVRGPGVFEKSIHSIRLLNAQGYGKVQDGLILNLVSNHDGPLIPGDRASLEARFKQELMSKYGLTFNRLFAVTNMPINRFRLQLKQSGTYDEYLSQLMGAFNESAARDMVCRSLISVSYDGRIYDCDFNQMLGMQITNQEPMTVFNFDLEALMHRKINFASHCFGCTAGGGSS